MATPTSHVWRMADRLADGTLEQRIAEMRAEEASPESISRRLFADYGIEVTRQTIYAWCAKLDSEVAA